MCGQFIPAAEKCFMLAAQFLFLCQIVLHLRLIFLADPLGFLNRLLNRQNTLFFFFFFLVACLQCFRICCSSSRIVASS